MNIKPLGDRVVVKAEEAPENTSGIVIAQTEENDKQPEKGEVIAVGPGRLDEKGERVAVEVKVGDTVVFSKYGPTEVEVEDTEYLILKEDDILGVIEG